MDKNKEITVAKIFKSALENHQANKIEVAQNLYNQVLEIDPTHNDTLNNLGVLFQSYGDIQKAKLFFEKTTKLDPNHLDAHNNLGKLYKELEEHQKAKKCYEKVIRLDPNNIHTHNNLGLVNHILGEHQKSISCFEKTIKIDPNYLEGHNNLGFIFLNLNEYQKAKSYYKKVIEINPNNADAYNNLGIIYKELGELRKAIACYERVIEINPNYLGVDSNLGIIYSLLNNAIKSVEHHRKALANQSKINFDVEEKNNQSLSPATSAFFLELTNKCNFHCEFCPSDSQTRLHGYMEMSLVKKIFNEISQKKIVPIVNLHLMGEPTLHPKLNEILTYAKSKNVKVALTTNGSTLVKKRIPNLLDSISGKIVASLMTPTKDSYKIRGDVGLSWDRYIGNFQLLIQEHLKKILRNDKIEYEIAFRVMVSNEHRKGIVKVLDSSKSIQDNYEEWSNFTRKVEKELGLKQFHRQKIDSDNIFTLFENGAHEVSFYLQKNIKLQFWRAFTFANARVSDEYKLEPAEKTKFCPHPFTDFGVLWNGDVSLCALDYDGTLKVGNVNDHSVEDVMKSTASKKLRASMYGLEKLHPTCVKCQSLPVEK